jgi:hypothetical protein
MHVTRAQIREVSCPHCRVAASQECQTPSGRTAPLHRRRRRLAKQVAGLTALNELITGRPTSADVGESHPPS